MEGGFGEEFEMLGAVSDVLDANLEARPDGRFKQSGDRSGRQRESNKHTRVVCSTFASRGKSLTPESRIDMLDDNSAFVDRKDETQEASGFAIPEDVLNPSRRPSGRINTSVPSNAEHPRTTLKSGVGSFFSSTRLQQTATWTPPLHHHNPINPYY